MGRRFLSLAIQSAPEAAAAFKIAGLALITTATIIALEWLVVGR